MKFQSKIWVENLGRNLDGISVKYLGRKIWVEKFGSKNLGRKNWVEKFGLKKLGSKLFHVFANECCSKCFCNSNKKIQINLLNSTTKPLAKNRSI